MLFEIGILLCIILCVIIWYRLNLIERTIQLNINIMKLLEKRINELDRDLSKLEDNTYIEVEFE